MSDRRIPREDLERAFAVEERRREFRKDPLQVRSKPSVITLALLGVLLPLVTLTIELLTRQCATTFFDPMPTWFHTAMVAVVPLVNTLVILTLIGRRAEWLRWIVPLQGFATGIAIAYSLLFAILIPLALIALAFMGWGLLPLTPLLSLIATSRGYRKVKANFQSKDGGYFWPALLVGLGIMLIYPAHSAFTTWAVRKAASEDKVESARGLWVARHLTTEGALLRLCYPAPNREFFGGGAGDNALVQDARDVFYRVSGKAFTDFPVPQSRRFGMRAGEGRWNLDEDLGGDAVASCVPGLSMTASRLDSKADAKAGTSYTEWTFVFKNVAANASEARAQIELPEGGVVSRLTLWIDGQPQEAAFGGRAQVKAAYKEIAVVQRRDPVLVTSAGPNRILMQCFPVPANGGEMKVRLGITAPTRVVDGARSEVLFPRILERNFTYSADLGHDLWLEADGGITTAAGTGSAGVLKKQISEEHLRGFYSATIAVSVAGDVWSADPTSPGFAIRQVTREAPAAVPDRVVLVIDGSVAMRPHQKSIARQALRALPRGKPVSVVFAGDEPEEVWPDLRNVTDKDIDDAVRWLEERKATGGRNNLPALLSAWDKVSVTTGTGAIVWVHGTQPVLGSRKKEELLQRLEREKNPPVIYDLCVEAGPNRIIELMDGFTGLRVLRYGGAPAEDLAMQFQRWRDGSKEWVRERSRVPVSEKPESSLKGDTHVARLWATEEVERLRGGSERGSLDSAVKLAIDMHVVTPVSGAVVLETAEQYTRHNLTQGATEDSPTVPEPDAAALLAISLAALLGGQRFRRRSPFAQS